jgi:glycosyltransferase involved in cell wall biosynthesis
MKISVIIPVYNEEKYIKNCLDSFSNQIEKPDEIIIVNNNCSDQTINIAKNYPVKIIEEKKQGIVFARNKGFNVASGDILGRCDADSILPSNWIKKIKEDFSKNKIDGLTGPVIFYDLPFKTTFYSIFYLKAMKILQNGETLIGPNMAITKKIWRKIKATICVDEKTIHEDIDLSLHIKKIGGKIKYDWQLIAFISGRRIKKKPQSFFIEYPIRLIKNIYFHKK